MFTLESACRRVQPDRESSGPIMTNDPTQGQTRKSAKGHTRVASYLRSLDNSPGVYRMLDDKGAGLTLSIRAESPNALTKGSKALIISYDADTNVYFVEPYDAIIAPSAPTRSSARAKSHKLEETSEVGAKRRT